MIGHSPVSIRALSHLSQELREKPGRPDRQAPREIQVPRGAAANRVPPDLVAPRATQAGEVNPVPPESVAPVASPAFQENPARQESGDRAVSQGFLEKRAPLALRASAAPRERTESQVPRDRSALLVNLASQENLARKATPERPENGATEVQPAPRDQPATPASVAPRESTAT
jgi:hypothetical protein